MKSKSPDIAKFEKLRETVPALPATQVTLQVKPDGTIVVMFVDDETNLVGSNSFALDTTAAMALMNGMVTVMELAARNGVDCNCPECRAERTIN